MSNENKTTQSTVWKPYQRILFRIAFPFFIIMCIPLEGNWYKHLIHIDWTNLHCRDLYDIALVENEFVPAVDGWWGLGSYLTWFISLFVATVIAIIWSLLDSKRQEYTFLYKWLRVLVRYRTAIGVIAFSFEKIFPTQMPYPSLANLATDFGDLNGHKIFWTSIGIVPWYQVFGGFMELIPGVMLLFRRTATWGALLTVSVLLTIVFINLGYNYHPGGIHVYASYFVLLGLFLLVPDLQKIYTLLVLEKSSDPVNGYPAITENWQQYLRVGVKISIGIYAIVFGYLFYLNFRYDPYKQPSTPGIKALRGYYEVVEFKINNKEIPYSPVDSVRWQDVTFESWTTLTYRLNKTHSLSTAGGKSSSNTGHSSVDLEKSYEVGGVAGGRRAFHYYADTIQQVLYLQDKKKRKNPDPYPSDWISAEAWKNIGDDNHKINEKAWSTRRDRDFALSNKTLERDKMILRYATTDGSRVVLTGTNENKDSLYVVLTKIDRKNTLSRSTLEAGTYY